MSRRIVLSAAAALAHDDEPVERLNFQRNTIEHPFPGKIEAHIAQLDNVILRMAHGKNTM